MKSFEFNTAMSIRTYGVVTVDAETIDEAKAKLTAEYVADNFEPHGGGSDDFDFNHPAEICFDGYVAVCDHDAADNEPMDWDLNIEYFEVPDGEWIKNPEYAIAAMLDGELLWWSNDDGWGAWETRTIFTEDETRFGHMPLLDNGKAHWVLEKK